ncbi:MAG: SIR2 family protein [Betaproteobacteria bacterium]|nr:SIR2 family protein [Betaproteobacteria bacterium]
MLRPDILQKVQHTLFSGQYNLLLGSGISLDSKDQQGRKLLSAGDLQEKIADIKDVKKTWPLTRLYPLLSEEEREQYLTVPYSNCIPGETVTMIPNFIWERIFTFNIDDAVENAYKAALKPAQHVRPVNYNLQYFTHSSRKEALVIHLHGYTQSPKDGYVFSQSEYGRVSSSANPWMMVLSELLATEPFIIAGTSLTEPDLEHYLSSRNEISPRLDRGPSILVEPHPDAVTRSDCVRHGLVLVEASFHDFLKWLREKLGPTPSLETLVVPSKDELFIPNLNSSKKISFFSSFELVEPVIPTNINGTLSGFYLGQAPTWNDLASSVDLPVEDILRLTQLAKRFLDSGIKSNSATILLGEPGTGKTTILRRIAYNLATDYVVFALKSQSIVEIDEVIECLMSLQNKCILIVDDVAENANTVRSLLEAENLDGRFLLLGAERAYRRKHIENTLEELSYSFFNVESWKERNYIQLIEHFRTLGLVTDSDALKNPMDVAKKFATNEDVASATCRILNNFKPIRRIAQSLWEEASNDSKLSYLIAALAEYCSSLGVLYSVLHSAHHTAGLANQVNHEHPLPLCFIEKDSDYIVPLNATIGESVLMLACENHQEVIFDAFVALAKALAPHVSRNTIRQQTSEARLSGRLFNADDIVFRLLGENAGRFYETVQKQWEWNSRYWEHRAILLANRDIEMAIQYARHAVAIEAHPFPWTTLASLLFRRMAKGNDLDTTFKEAVDLLIKTLNFDISRLRRQSRHGYLALFGGTTKYVELGGTLSPVLRQEIIFWITDARTRFKNASGMTDVIMKLENEIL